MKFYDKEILVIFKKLPGIQNNRYNPVITHKSFANTSYVNLRIPKFFLRFWRANFLYPYLSLLVWSFCGGGPLVAVFENFLEKKKILLQKNKPHFLTLYKVSLDEIWGRYFSIRCRDFSISRGLQKNSLLRRHRELGTPGTFLVPSSWQKELWYPLFLGW